MILNASLLRVDTPNAASPAGDVTFTQGASIDVRCFLDGVSSSQRFVLGDVGQDATAMLFVRKADLGTAAVIAARCQVVVQLDGESDQRVFQVLNGTDRVKGDLSHFEFALKGL